MIEGNASYPFPVIGARRMDYCAPSRYQTVDWFVSDGKVHFRHQVEGKNLVSDLLLEGKALFACVVVMRATMYRRTFTADEYGVLECGQVIELEEGYLSREAPKFLPIILYQHNDNFYGLANELMGLDDLWVDKQIQICKGAIIGRDLWHYLPGNSNWLVRFQEDEHLVLSEGGMSVIFCEEESGFFLAKVSSDVFHGMTRAKGAGALKHRNSIITHALAMGLAEVAKATADKSITDGAFENLITIKTMLESKGIPTWEDEENFDATVAACCLQPLEISTTDKYEEDED